MLNFENIKLSAPSLANCGCAKRNEVLEKIAVLLDERRNDIKKANTIDICVAEKSNISKAMVDRLTLDDKGINNIITSVREIKSQDEVVGVIVGGGVRPNGLKIEKVRVPLGVVGIIYESRPNVTVDAAALCIKSGNAVILRGGKEAINSNIILANIIREALKTIGLPEEIVTFVEDTDRQKIKEIAEAVGFVDIIIPRGGSALINYVRDVAKIPVVFHDKGVCHTFIDESADMEKAVEISVNAKVSRPSTCNSMETLLIHKNIAGKVLPPLAKELLGADVELRGCKDSCKITPMKLALEADWYEEYSDLVLSIKIVDSIDKAMEHITKYGSHHSDAIITESYYNAEKFLNTIDSACVYVNASTRFTDGGEFGLGAEIGISTQKLHVRGPMSAVDLTTIKYKIYGDGQVR